MTETGIHKNAEVIDLVHGHGYLPVIWKKFKSERGGGKTRVDPRAWKYVKFYSVSSTRTCHAQVKCSLNIERNIHVYIPLLKEKNNIRGRRLWHDPPSVFDQPLAPFTRTNRKKTQTKKTSSSRICFSPFVCTGHIYNSSTSWTTSPSTMPK